MNAAERRVMEQALEAMLNFPDDISDAMFESIRALRAALAQQQPEPVQEPVAGAVLNADGRPVLVRNGMEDWYCKERNARRLYAAPPQRPPLTDAEIVDAVRDADLDWQAGWTLDEHEPNRFTTLARAIERKVRGEA